jgi:UDP-N-acetyl-D-glucosamine dehydrogenase
MHDQRQGFFMELVDKIKNKNAKVGIIGLGYVGLPLALAFSKSGFDVYGFDIDRKKIDTLQAGRSYIQHIDFKKICEVIDEGKFKPITDFDLLKDTDCIIICVPTPLNRNREPDLSYVFDTTRTVAKHLRKGQLIILESTTYPGTTDEDMRAILEETGLKAGEDFYLAYSPEREDPNNKAFSLTNTPKVIGGFTEQCLEATKALYESILIETISVSSTKAAEAAKLLENIYRAVNIALVNELKILFDRMGIDIWEVIDAAKTKPFGFQAFYPGPGLGGHCIPIDPFYLTWKAREYDFETRFIELAGTVNTYMPYYVVEKTIQALNDRNISVKDSKILILGLAYKRDVGDIRESPSLKVIDLFLTHGAKVNYNDPFVLEMPKNRKYNFQMRSVPLSEANLWEYDCIVISTDHSSYDYEFIVKNSRLIVDTRNATGKLRSDKIVKA